MDLQFKRQLKAACRPDEPVQPGDPRHYDFDAPELHLRGRPWRAWLADEIRLSTSPTAQLVTGLRGSGKTTELKQLEKLLTDEGYRVVYADIGAWLSDAAPLTTTDLLLALVLALYPSGTPSGTSGWLRDYAAQVGKFFGSDVALEGGVAGIRAKLTTDETLFQSVAKRLHERDGLREDVFELLERAAAAAFAQGEELVLILDGGEKRATGELFDHGKKALFQNAWFGAFVLQGRDLRPPIHTIYTVPPFMVRRTSELAANFGCELQFLPMVRVLSHAGGLNETGLRAMVAALGRRVPLECFAEPAVPVWLAAHSGGYFRDLMRFMNFMIHAVGDEPAFTREHARYAVEQVRQSYTQGLGLVLEEKRVLQQLHPSKRFPEHEDARERMDSLLQGFKMFRYHNDRDWYDAHPLLWPVLELDDVEDVITWPRAVEIAGPSSGEDPPEGA
ncbi:hypothetical protein [Enhygromyxa salina]|nr:hypothetical protein [Enhygromyxa salina]